VDIIVKDEHGVRVHQISERLNVQQIHIVKNERVAVVIVRHDKLQIQQNVDVKIVHKRQIVHDYLIVIYMFG